MNPNVNAYTLVLVSATLCLIASTPALAQPVGSVDLQFSVDGGTVFTDSAMVDDMETFLLRINFDNTGDAAGTASVVATNLPAGFARVAGTTRVCVEPTPGEVICNTDAGQGGMIDEPGVWSGQDLTISPTTGLFGEGVGLTSGTLEFGKKRFLNLHDCHYFNGAERFFVTADPDISGTNVGAAADAAAACAGSEGGYGLAGAELRTADLLANRYLNYHECHYNFFTDHIIRITDGTATRASNDLDAAFNCAGTAGAHILHPDSAVTNFDLLGRRYLNLWECRATVSGDVISVNSIFGIGSNTSSTPDAAPACPAMVGSYGLIDSDLLALDLLDSTRGGGFVQVEVRAMSGAGMFDIDGSLAAAEFATEMDTGTITVVAEAVPTPVPSVDLVYSHSCGLTFTDTATPYPGEVFTTRVYFDNTGTGAGSGSSITTTVPNDYTLVPGSTRVCLEPTPGEIVCNDDADQGGPIDEAAVWSGQTLTIAPMAGLHGESPAATTGTLEIGRKRYLNLHECHYYNGFNDRLFLTVDQAGTNAANTADTTAVCGPVAHGRNLVSGNVSSFDLLTGRYLNLHECQYHFFFSDRIFLAGTDFTGSNVSGTPDAAVTCAPTAGAHSALPAESNLEVLDLAGNRYLNLHECVLLNLGDHVGITAGGANGTNTSNTEDSLVVCPSSSGIHNLVAGGVAAVDLLDATRGRGFVEFQVNAGAVVGNFDQTAELSGNEFMAVTNMEQIQAVAGVLFKHDFECGTTDGWSATVIEP